MARRKAAEKKTGDQGEGVQRVQADHDSLAVGSFHVDGDVDAPVVFGHDNVVTLGFTAEQASAFLKQIQRDFQPRPFDGTCPYKGLDVFTEDDVELFFGRETIVKDLVLRVRESRAIFVTGPSGSGKSSLVRAGLIPALKKAEFSRRWLYAALMPERDPFEALARAFSRLKDPSLGKYFRENAQQASVLNDCAESALSDDPDQRLMLFVDQFEEVFTQLSRDKTQAFINLIDHAATVEHGRLILLFSLRSDFLSICQTYPQLNALLGRTYAFAPLAAMQPEDLASAIAQPALRVGLKIDPALVAQIINDMQGRPGALPLMQFALKDLFDSQQAGQARGGVIALTLEDYLGHGGIHKSLEQHADNSFARLSEGEQGVARSIFSRLIETGRGTQDTRRTALFEELVTANANPEQIKAVVQKLADARLIITDEKEGKDTVTISHEKLIDAWPWLKKLVNENREAIALQNEIANDAKEWEDHQHDTSYLYTGARLANAREQLKASKLVLSGLAQEFIEVGAKAYADELEAANRRAARLRQRSVYLTVALVAALITVSVAVFFSVQSQKQAIIAHARELGTQAILQRDNNFLLSLLLGVEAFHTADLSITRGALLDNTTSNPQLIRFLSGHSDSVSSVAFSPDGKTLASGSNDRTIILWDTKTHQPIGRQLKGHSDSVSSVAFSPDGKTLTSGSTDGTLILWDVKTHQPIGQPLKGHRGWISSVAFSPDGKILASGSADNTIILWDVKTHQPLSEPLKGHRHWVFSVTFSPDGNILASGSADNTIILWNVKTHQPLSEPLKGHGNSVSSVTFSPDGNILASGSTDGTLILWDVKTHKPLSEPLKGHRNWVSSVAFSPDGKTLASGSGDNTLILWDVKTHQPIGQPLKGHRNWVFSVNFSPDGKTLASGSADHTVILWDAKVHQPLSEPLKGHGNWVSSVAFSADGKTLASGSGDTTIILWDVKTHQPMGQPLKGNGSWVLSVAFSADGKTLAAGNADNTIILWDVKTHQPIGQPLKGHANAVSSVAFSPDGNILASGSGDTTIILWDVKTHQPIGQPLKGHANAVSSVAFSPDGNILASGNADNTIILWDVKTHQPIGQPLKGHSGFVFSVAFSPYGKTLASGSADHTVILWDVKTHQPIGQPLKGHGIWVSSVAFSPDGNILASGGTDDTVILWDVKTHQPIREPLKGHGNAVSSVAFSSDGKTLASGSADHTVILWDVYPQSWVEKSCQRAGRNFTRAEWLQYSAGKPYPTKQEEATCPQWPLEPEATTIASPTP